MLICNKCGIEKSFDNFNKDKTSKRGFGYTCKLCHGLIYSKANGYENPKHKERRLQSKVRREQFNDQPITCKKCGNAKLRKDWPKLKDGRILETCCSLRKAERVKNISDGCLSCRTCQARNPFNKFPVNKKNKLHGRQTQCLECQAQNMRLYKHSNPLAKSVWDKTRRARIISASDGSLTAKTIASLYAAFVYCPYCGIHMREQDKSLDHVLPLARGGAHSINNVLVCCIECNTKKGARLISEWLDREALLRVKTLQGQIYQ